MDPSILLALIKLAVVSIAVVIVLSILTYKEVVNWFRERTEMKNADKDNLTFTLQTKLSSGNYTTVQGVFNTRTSEVVDGRTVNSQKVDGTLKNLHDRDELIVYN